MKNGSNAKGGNSARKLSLTVGRPDLLIDGGDEEFRQLVHNLLAFSGKLQEVRDRLGEMIGLSGPAYTILISVAHLSARSEVGVTTLARHLNLSQPYITAEVNKLVAAGLLDKSASNHDGRSVSLTVTPAGMRRLAELAPRQRAVNDRLFTHLTSASFVELSRLADRFVHDADSALELAARLLHDEAPDELSGGLSNIEVPEAALSSEITPSPQ